MQTPVIEAQQLTGMSRLQLLDATPGAMPTAGRRRYGRVSALPLPMADWIAVSLAPDTGFDRHGYWLNALDQAGVEVSANLVVFDDGRMTEASRIWFLLQHLRLHCRVLNGGSATLTALDQTLDGHLRPEKGPGPDAAFHTNPVAWVERSDLRADLAAGQVRILDCRTPEEWSGDNRRDNPRAGHLPDSFLLPHRELLDGNRLQPVTTLRQRFEEAGLARDDRAIVSLCNGGGRAALAVLAAVHAGFGAVGLYYRGFADWSRDPKCPLAQGISSTRYSGPSGSDGCRR